MNLDFSIAIHALTFLLKHKDEQFTSETLADLICVNPVQLRRVMRGLVAAGYVTSKKGKAGGYSVGAEIYSLPLSDLFELFRERPLDTRVITGDPESCCEVARNIGDYLVEMNEQEHQILRRFYATQTIGGILEGIEEKEKNHETV